MDDGKSAGGIGGRIAGAWRQPPVQLGERFAGSFALLFIIPRVTYMLMDYAVSVEVWQVTNVTIPSPIMPSQPY